MFPQYIQPAAFSDYELIDSGNFEKLERFGQYVLARPEPQAIWHKSMSEEEWKNKAHAWFRLNDNTHNKETWRVGVEKRYASAMAGQLCL